MNKTEFLEKLKARLSDIPEEYQKASVLYYTELLDEYIESGYTEESAVSHLPHLDHIVDQIHADPTLPMQKMNTYSHRTSIHEEPPPPSLPKLRGWQKALLILAFPIWGIFLLLIAFLVLFFFIFCFLLVVAVYAIDFALAALAIAALIASPIPALLRTSLPSILLLLGVAFLCGGLSILMFRGANHLTIHVLRFCRYVYFRNRAKYRERRAAV